MSRDRERDKKRDQEDEEEAYERRKLERKLRDKEAAYQEVGAAANVRQRAHPALLPPCGRNRPPHKCDKYSIRPSQS